MSETVTPHIGTITEWDDEQWKYFKSWLQDLLRKEIVEITFIKSDSTERTMKCTMSYDIINVGIKLLEEKKKKQSESSTEPLQNKPARQKPKQNNDNITVWDVDVENWRSFKVKSITNILTLIMKYDYKYEPLF